MPRGSRTSGRASCVGSIAGISPTSSLTALAAWTQKIDFVDRLSCNRDEIKALKAARAIRATRERVDKRRGSAEEPVTARIRRRMEATLATREVTP